MLRKDWAARSGEREIGDTPRPPDERSKPGHDFVSAEKSGRMSPLTPLTSDFLRYIFYRKGQTNARVKTA